MTKARNLVGDYAPDFELPGIDKQVYHLGRYLEKFKALGVVFLGNNCPYVRGYLERLKQIQADFEADNFTLVAINSNDANGTIQESFETMDSFARENQLNFPYLRDPTQDVAKSFGATVIPEVFLLDSKAVIRYVGSIDDSPESAEGVTNAYLRNNISALLAGKEISPTYIEPIGSAMLWRENKT